jgi:hypothetical protein
MNPAAQLGGKFIDVLAATDHPLRRQWLVRWEQRPACLANHNGDYAILLWR